MVDTSWVAMERAIATAVTEAPRVTFVDPSDWACPTDPCATVVGRFLVYRDTHHLARPYVVALRDRLAAAFPDLRGP